MLKNIMTDVKYILNTKAAIITWYINLIFVLRNFFYNVKINCARIYITEMYEIPKLLLLSDWSISGFFYMIIFPLIVVFPTHSLFIKDKKSGINSYIKSRVTNTSYCVYRIISVFISTFILFVLPLIVELVLSIICLEPSANGDPSNFEYYVTAKEAAAYPLHTLYFENKFIYALVWILLFGCVCGIFAIINLAIATFLKLKYSIFAMLPLYIILTFTNNLDSMLKSKYTYQYTYILKMFSFGQKNYLVFSLIVIISLIISIGLLLWSERKR